MSFLSAVSVIPSIRKALVVKDWSDKAAMHYNITLSLLVLLVVYVQYVCYTTTVVELPLQQQLLLALECLQYCAYPTILNLLPSEHSRTNQQP